MDATSKSKTATLTVGNKTYDFPILSGSVGPDVIDIAKLYAQSGMFTYDPGFTSTGSCQSKITYIDGDAGILEYRGYPIEQLAQNGDCIGARQAEAGHQLLDERRRGMFKEVLVYGEADTLRERGQCLCGHGRSLRHER
jgi:hypothetical protein